MKQLKKTNINLVELIHDLRHSSWKHNAPIWKDLAVRLAKPSRNWAEVNLSHISRHCKVNEIVLVPGVLLGAGELKVPVTIVAYRMTGKAKEKLVRSGGKALSIQELIKTNPKGKGVKIIG